MDKLKKNRKYISLGVLGFLIMVLGVSFAYWRLTLTQTGTNQIASSCLNITLTNEQNAINLQKAYPILDEEGMSLTPYTFTITNNCNTIASYSVNLELLETVLEENRLSSGFVKVMLDNNTPTVLNTNTSVTPTLSNAYEAYELTTGYLDANASVTYNLRLWMDGDVTIEDDAMNKQLESKITITASYVDHMPTDYELCVEDYGAENPQCEIIASVDNTGKCPEVNEEGQILVSNIEDTESLVCSAPDDYGNSYYFRGDVENNYVYFAGYYWRIVRVNGDGSVRIVYDGTSPHQNGESSYDRQLGNSRYNQNYNDNAYVGYMYGTPGSSTPDIEEVGYMYETSESSTYNETHANINDSTIKTVVDNWYKTNIVDTGYSRYVSDTLFCNDRSLLPEEAFSLEGFDYTQLGYGQNNTNYRWGGDPSAAQIGSDYLQLLTYPNFQCTQKNDRFTVNDEVTGNGSLTYPVGLLTTDDIYAAGGYTASNYNYYLYTGYQYWTMSPYDFNGISASVRSVDYGGNADYAGNVKISYGVRPALNLKSGSLTEGSGTATDPYLVG